MRLPKWIWRGIWNITYRFADRRTIRGIPVGVLMSEEASDTAFLKVDQALELIERYDPRSHARLRRLARVLVFGTTGPSGEWFRDPRLIRLGERQLLSQDTQAAHVAATLVHELTHAWLDHLGFDYRPDRRSRTEALCYRAEAVFAGRIPGGKPLATYYRQRSHSVLEGGDAAWSDRAFADRAAARLRSLGVPNWLIRITSRVLRTPE